MNADFLTILGAAVASGIFSSIVTIAAIRVELRWLRRDIDSLNKRVNRLEFPRQPFGVTSQ